MLQEHEPDPCFVFLHAPYEQTEIIHYHLRLILRFSKFLSNPQYQSFRPFNVLTTLVRLPYLDGVDFRHRLMKP